MASSTTPTSYPYPLGTSHPFPNSLQQWGEALALAVLYVVLARLGQQLAIAPGNITPVWLQSGFIFAALLLRGFYLWPGVFLGAFIGNVWAYFDADVLDVAFRSLCSGTLNGLGDVLCAGIGASVMRKQLAGDEPYLNVVSVSCFVLYAALAGSLVSALFGISGLVGFGFLPLELAATAFLTWMTGDAVGVLVFGSLLMVWRLPRDSLLAISGPSRYEYVSFAIVSLSLLLVSSLYIYSGHTLSSGLPLMMLLPLQAWSILRLGSRWTFASTTVISCIAVIIYATQQSESPVNTITSELVVLQSFVAVLMITVLLITAVTYQWSDTYQHMKDAKKIAEESNRFKTNFLSAVSHELRTPMNGVIGFTDLLKHTHLNTQQQGYLDGVEKSVDHMMGLIDELLELARAESNKVVIVKENFSPPALLDETVEMFNPLLHQQLKLRVCIDEELPDWLLGDTKRIRQILVNFLSNAFKYTSEGEIILKAEKSSAGRIRFGVKDSGVGIRPEDQEDIFEPFSAISQSNKSVAGTGLGLHICSRLAHSMAGFIGLESEWQQGSFFWFEIPLEVGVASVDDKTTVVAEQFDHLNLNVLVAEDNAVNRKLITKLLERFGCRCQLAVNGAKAVELAEQQCFDIIIMDCMMPDVDGYQAARQIRSRCALNQNTPIIALTANALQENRDQCYEAGMNEFVTKPISVSNLYSALVQFQHGLDGAGGSRPS